MYDVTCHLLLRRKNMKLTVFNSLSLALGKEKRKKASNSGECI
jgi:hypothetical protein